LLFPCHETEHHGHEFGLLCHEYVHVFIIT